MQNARSYSYKQHVLVCKHNYTKKSIMITFAERLSMSVPICVVEKENICKYSFVQLSQSLFVQYNKRDTNRDTLIT